MKRDDFLQLMYERSTGNGYVVNCDSYELEFVNPPMLRLLGQPFDSWENQLCYAFIYGKTSPCNFCKMHKTKIDHTTRWYFDHPLTHHAMLMRDFKICVNEETLFLQTSYHIPNETAQLQLLTATMTAEQLLTACAKTLTGNDGCMEILLAEITTFYGGHGGFLFYQDIDTDTFSLHHSYTANEQFFSPKHKEIPSFTLTKTDNWFAKLLSHPYITLDYTSMEDFPHPIQSLCQGTLILAPILIDEQLVGILGIQQVTENQEEFCLIPTILGFLCNYFSLRDTIYTLETQQEACETVLKSVKTLVTKQDIQLGIYQLLEDLTTYFDGDLALLIKNNYGQLQITNQFVNANYNGSEFHLTNDSLQELNHCFETFGHDDLIMIPNVLSILNDCTADVAHTLTQHQINSLLGMRLHNNHETTYYLMVHNPKAHQKNDTLLRSIKQFVETHLAKDVLLKKLSELSFMDSLTGLYNRNFYHHYLEHELEHKITQQFALLYVDVNGLKKANDNFGHEIGDILLKWSALFLKRETQGICFRLGGDEFLCILENCSLLDFQEKKDTINYKLSTYPEKHLSLGWYFANIGTDITQALKEADHAMYLEKQNYYKEQSMDTRSICEALNTFHENVRKLALEYE